MKKLLLLPLLLIISFSLVGEDNYALSLEKDLLLGASALGLNIPGMVLSSGAQNNMTLDDINSLDRNLAFFKYNKTQDDISTLLAAGILTFPVLTPLFQFEDLNTWVTYGVMYAEAFLLTNGAKDLLKSLIARNRPYTYTSIPPSQVSDYFNSFPSGHTAYAFLGATFLSTTFSKEYPDSPWKLPLIISSYTLAAGVGTMRLTSGNHFLTDVLAGAALGALFGWGIPFLHEMGPKKESGLYITPTPKAFSIGFRSNL